MFAVCLLINSCWRFHVWV